MLKIYHNNRCSKSRQALELTRNAGKEVEVIDYLKTPPTAADLQVILRKLHMKPDQLIRKNEAIYKDRFKGKNLTDEEWIQAKVSYPVLIERPIVVKGEEAVVGRPPEKVQELL
ncbi:arsenate reductase (glutaredoxin) [Pontibacter toksunensis]|uniref:Arsenate reductase (Glutaredoxin) n=1 Tax=Pontibacter toksunensis TaxID=1332631 RepID=A0ABW6BMB7_9BACT